jgi:hypothetical protein
MNKLIQTYTSIDQQINNFDKIKNFSQSIQKKFEKIKQEPSQRIPELKQKIENLEKKCDNDLKVLFYIIKAEEAHLKRVKRGDFSIQATYEQRKRRISGY